MTSGGAVKRAERVCELWLAGKSKEEIAEDVGCNVSSINYYLNKGGIFQRRSIENAIPMIIKLRQQDKTLKEISDATGFSKKVISRELNKRDLGYRMNHLKLDFKKPEEEKDPNLVYAERKPRIFRVEHEGKKYLDITEFYGI